MAEEHAALEEATEEQIRVLVRVRPPLSEADRAGEAPVHVEDGARVRVNRGDRGSSQLVAEFDAALGPAASQSEVYEQAYGVVKGALAGVNGTIFAYGQTGSGKTYTMFGGMVADEPAAAPTEARGVAPRVLEDVFAHAAARAADNIRVAISISLVELYNEVLSDMLVVKTRGGGGAQQAPAEPLSLREDKTSGAVYVHGLTEVPVLSPAHAARLVEKALRERAVRCTDGNARSSRSHAVLQLTIEQEDAPRGQTVDEGAGAAPRSALRSVLRLVDHAGSERVTAMRMGELSAEHKREMTRINVSLSALANCIAALCAPAATARLRRRPVAVTP